MITTNHRLQHSQNPVLQEGTIKVRFEFQDILPRGYQLPSYEFTNKIITQCYFTLLSRDHDHTVFIYDWCTLIVC